MTMELLPIYVISFLVSLFVAWMVYPKILCISIRKNIVDSPNARKLQKMPVPILGGFVVFSGIITALFCVSSLVNTGQLFIVLCMMTIMLLTGLADDIISLTAKERFIMEISIFLLLIAADHNLIINNFHGLWDIYEIPNYIGIPLTIIAGVGILNAINLIDGVDGLSSGYCILACIMFTILFIRTHNILNVFIAITAIGGIIPFFLHNVFGKYSKMFIGDAGTLLLGTIMAYFVISALRSETSQTILTSNFGIIPLLLAILAVPVFDTLRVMTTRILKGTSPFNPDKTHLHHLFIRLGFTHIGTTIAILTLNLLSLTIWVILYYTGASIDIQFYAVLVFNIFITVILYQYTDKKLSEIQNKQNPSYPMLISILKALGRALSIGRGPVMKALGRWLDNCVKPEDKKLLLG